MASVAHSYTSVPCSVYMWVRIYCKNNAQMLCSESVLLIKHNITWLCPHVIYAGTCIPSLEGFLLITGNKRTLVLYTWFGKSRLGGARWLMWRANHPSNQQLQWPITQDGCHGKYSTYHYTCPTHSSPVLKPHLPTAADCLPDSKGTADLQRRFPLTQVHRKWRCASPDSIHNVCYKCAH